MLPDVCVCPLFTIGCSPELLEADLLAMFSGWACTTDPARLAEAWPCTLYTSAPFTYSGLYGDTTNTIVTTFTSAASVAPIWAFAHGVRLRWQSSDLPPQTSPTPIHTSSSSSPATRTGAGGVSIPNHKSNTLRLGLEIGISLGVITLLGVFAFLFLRIRRKSRKLQSDEIPAAVDPQGREKILMEVETEQNTVPQLHSNITELPANAALAARNAPNADGMAELPSKDMVETSHTASAATMAIPHDALQLELRRIQERRQLLDERRQLNEEYERLMDEESRTLALLRQSNSGHYRPPVEAP
jgi:hypothetical protein